jgi:hypothetical protein
MSNNPAIQPATDNVELVPLALLAPELGVTVDELARRLGDDVTTSEIGLRCVSACGMNGAEIGAALRVEPHLAPYVEDDDETIDDARERFEVAQRAAERRLAEERITYQRRYVKASGLVTTCLAPDSNRQSGAPL